jgi:hypothetical protein
MEDKEKKIDIEKQLKVKVTMLSGMLTGALFKSILHPLDTIKVKILVRNFLGWANITKRRTFCELLVEYLFLIRHRSALIKSTSEAS